jgi:hypothetical protein
MSLGKGGTHGREEAGPQATQEAEAKEVLTEPQGPSAVDLGGMRLELRRVADLRPADYNPRTITPEALAGLRASIETWGMVEPIVWNRRSGRVVGGHQRLKALQEAGEETVVVSVVDLSDAEERALNLTLNNDALMGSFNERTNELLAAAKEALSEELFKDLRFEEIFYPGKRLDFVPGAALDYGLAEPLPEEGEITDANLRSLRLIMNEDQLAEIKGLIRQVGDLTGRENPTDIVLAALRFAADGMPDDPRSP